VGRGTEPGQHYYRVQGDIPHEFDDVQNNGKSHPPVA
jgi:hypothetical protein